MTVQEKMKQMFGIAFNGDNSFFSGKEKLNGIIDCSGIGCSECPLRHNCNRKGVREWLNSEYKEEEAVKPTLKAEYERGVADGRQQVYAELSKIFMR